MFNCRTLVLVVIGALWSVPASTQAVSLKGSEIEKLLGIHVDARGITFQVLSNGCTQKDDFQVQIFGAKPLQLLLLRDRPDFCEAFVPYGKRIRFSYQELGLRDGKLMRVLNPLSTIRVVQGV